MASLRLRIDGNTFRDREGREVILRGINLDGTAKYPKTPDIPSYIPDGFYDADNVSFVGRPFSLDEAHIHFERLRAWGYNNIRYIFTWEAIEAGGPKKYDEEWISFTIEVLRLSKSYGFYVYMDPHQDVWSRLSGGSGAPMWTLYAAGFNPHNFNVTQAAFVQNTYPEPAKFPKMLWSTNYVRLVCQTMFTLFWAGRDFAPKAIIDGRNIQDFLQEHFIAACKHLASRIHEAGDLENEVIIGWESINEPNRGLVGIQDISVIPPEQQLQLGTSPTAFQGMMTGVGHPCEITTWAFGSFGPHQTGRELVDPKGASAWLEDFQYDAFYGWKRDPQWKPGECLWAQHGVWDPSADTLLQKDYFSKDPKTGEKLDYQAFTNQYFIEHYRKFRDAIRSVHAEAMMFCQPPVMEIPPAINGTEDDDPNMVHAVHFYDGLTLMTKHWNRFYNVDVIGVLRGKYWSPAFAVKIGETAIRNCLRDQLHFLREESYDQMGHHPLIFTEIGIPYDLDDKYAYKTGDYSSQIRAMDANHYALEGSEANGYSIWNYTCQNTHEWGDQWNGEDLSIFSLDDAGLPSAVPGSPNEQSPVSGDRNSPSFSESRMARQDSQVEPNALRHTLERPSTLSQQSSVDDSSTTAGYRAAEAYIRPSPVATHGTLTKFGFDLQNCVFSLALEADTPTAQASPTVIYLPELHYPSLHTEVVVSGGKWEIERLEVGTRIIQFLKWWHSEGPQDIEITGAKRKISAAGDADEDEGYIEQCQQSSCVLM